MKRIILLLLALLLCISSVSCAEQGPIGGGDGTHDHTDDSGLHESDLDQSKPSESDPAQSDQPQSKPSVSDPPVSDPPVSDPPKDPPQTDKPACKHTWEQKVLVQVTCTVTGQIKYTCKNCAESYIEDQPATGHSLADATCTEPQICKACGTKVGTPLGHSYKDANCVDPATCTRCGKTTGEAGHKFNPATCTAPKTCAVCGATEGNAKGHSYRAATCVSPKTCSECAAIEGEVKGHSFKAATCTEPKTCTVCAVTVGEAKGHDFKAATCTEPKTCRACSLTEGSATGHSFREATCTDPKTCTVCAATEGSAKGHSYQDPTCTEPQTCKACGTKVGTPLGHSYKDANCTDPATCVRCGKTTGEAGHKFNPATCTSPKTCAVCGVTEGSANGHDFKHATCTEPRTCLVCAATEGAAKGHDFKSATCTKPKTCGVCDITVGEPNGHSYKEATCTEPTTCTVCKVTYGQPIGHIYKAATCTTPKTCQICSATVGQANGHDYQNATCTAPKTCTVCFATTGEPKGHDFKHATCTEPRICLVCSAIEGQAKGHDFKAATCTTPKTCNVCAAIEGSALGHDFAQATCTTPKTCKRCALTEGTVSGHSFADATCTSPKTCTICAATEGKALGHDWSSPYLCIDRACGRCGTEEKASRAHTWNQVDDAAHICTECRLESPHGYVGDTCSSCGFVDEYRDNVADMDFGGEDFNILVSPTGTREWGGFFAEETATNSIDLATHHRNAQLEERFNINISATVPMDFNEFTQIMRNHFVAGIDEFDLAATQGMSAAALVTTESIKHWDDTPFIDPEKPYWFDNDSLMINGHHYFLNGMFSASVPDHMTVCLFNKEMADNYIVDIGDSYQAVRDGKWTMDLMYDHIRRVGMDNGDGRFDQYDQYGLSMEAGFANALITGGGNQLVSLNSAEPEYSYQSRNISGAIEKIQSLFTNLSGYVSGGTAPQEMFAEGRALYHITTLDQAIAMMRESMFNIGVLPMPKYSEMQREYCTASVVRAHLLVLPAMVDNQDRTGAVVEALCSTTYQRVLPTYLENLTRYSSSAEDYEMLTMIFMNGLTLDPATVFWGAPDYLTFNLLGTETSPVNVWFASKKGQLNSFYKEIIAKAK